MCSSDLLLAHAHACEAAGAPRGMILTVDFGAIGDTVRVAAELNRNRPAPTPTLEASLGYRLSGNSVRP